MATRKDPPELNDPDGHFPYKHEHVLNLVAENPAMGPEGPDDDRVRAEDYINEGIAHATKAYIDAQADHLRDPGEGTKELVDQAAADLVAARQAHRANRAGLTVVGIRARRVGE